MSGQVRYIKLGKKGEFEEQCIAEGTVRLDYRDVPHEICARGDWDAFIQHYVGRGTDAGTAKRHMNQVREFYTLPADTIWATFCFGRLHWCRAGTEVTLLPDLTKTRKVAGSWSDTDAGGRRLEERVLPGTVTATKGFRGTICSFSAEEALRRILAGERSPVATAALEANEALERAVEALIRDLSPQDFELLVDLIFRGAGYQRVSDVGKQLRDIDLDLISPLTDEHVAVQVKSRLDGAGLRRVEQELTDLSYDGRLYVAVHSPAGGLKSESELIELLLPGRLSELSIKYGLVAWLTDKVG